MKRFLMYLIVLVVCLFVGFTAYYAVQNKENFTLIDIQAGGYKCINVGETIDLPLLHERPYKTTTIAVESSNTSIVSYNEETKIFSGVAGGVSSITITTSNKNFGPYVFDIYVGDGTESNPYYISNANQLVKINENVNAYYKLVSDVDLRLYNEGVWTPLSAFNGNLDGDYHTISNLNITGTSTNVGLFTQINEGAKVENLKVNTVTISGTFENAGSIAGVNKGFIGKTSANRVNITNTQGNNGGLVGSVEFASNKSVVSMCEVKNLTLNTSNASNNGGIAGSLVAGSIINCQALVSSFNGSADTAVYGGIVGYASEVASPERVFILQNNFAMTNSNSAVGKIAGIVGKMVRTSAKNVVLNNYYTSSELNGLYGSEDVTGEYKYLSNIQLKEQASYIGFNFEDVWALEGSSSYAQLNFEGIYENISVYEVGKDITSAEEFTSAINDMRSDSFGKSYKISNDLTVDLNGAEWTPIDVFAGKLYADEGVSFVIKNFKIDASNLSNMNTFGFIKTNTGEIENITFEDVTITIPSDANISLSFTGVIAGINEGTIKNCKVVNATIESESSAFIGGISGINRSLIENVSFSGEILAGGNKLNVGGIVGYNSSNIKNSTAESTTITYTAPIVVSSEYINIGGIVGENALKVDGGVSKVTIQSTGLAKLYIGGVVGKNNASATVNYSYFAGEVTTSDNNLNSFAGGIVGMNGSKAIVSKSGNDGLITGTLVGGVVCNNYGIVSECYANGGKSSGVTVGGIVCNNYGSGNEEDPTTVINSYCTQTLEGLKDESVVSGIVSFLDINSTVKNCFGAGDLIGKGEKYAESASEFRFTLAENILDYPKVWVNKFYEFINVRQKVGTFENSIVTNYKTAKIQYKYSLIKTTGDTFVEVTDEQFVNGEYQDIFIENGFQSTIWYGIIEDKMVDEAVAKDFYPTLKNAYYPSEE